jgi:hypothetical protein
MFLSMKETNLKNGPVQSRTILYKIIVSDGVKKGELLGNMSRTRRETDCNLPFLEQFFPADQRMLCRPLETCARVSHINLQALHDVIS